VTPRHPSRCEFDSSSLLLRIDRTVPADVNAISTIVEDLMKVIGEMGCAEGEEFEVELSLREALANAIKHGTGSDPSKEVQICVACDQDRGMLIVVRDPGPGFDPGKLPSCVEGQNVYSTHGRGIFLISRYMDDVKFKRGGTEIHMRKHPRKARAKAER